MFPFIRFTNWKQESTITLSHSITSQKFPFIRFTNWKQDFQEQLLQLAELQLQFPFIRFMNWKQGRATLPLPKLTLFPFIRFTNWKQDWFMTVIIASAGKFPFIRFTNWKQASLRRELQTRDQTMFPFIRFTNWKQVRGGGVSKGINPVVSIHTLHELEASPVVNLYTEASVLKFPFIRFTNWKQV